VLDCVDAVSPDAEEPEVAVDVGDVDAPDPVRTSQW